MQRIVRSVLFTIHEGMVLNDDKEAVAEFLGSPEHEEEFSHLGYSSSNKDDVLCFIRRISPKGQLIQLYKGPSGYGGGCEECVLAQVESVF